MIALYHGVQFLHLEDSAAVNALKELLYTLWKNVLARKCTLATILDPIKEIDFVGIIQVS